MFEFAAEAAANDVLDRLASGHRDLGRGVVVDGAEGDEDRRGRAAGRIEAGTAAAFRWFGMFIAP